MQKLCIGLNFLLVMQKGQTFIDFTQEMANIVKSSMILMIVGT